MRKWVLLVLAMFLPWVANAQEHNAESVWTDELREFDRAENAAIEYATTNFGVGILIHVGTEAAERGIEQNIGANLSALFANPALLPEQVRVDYCPHITRAELEGIEGAPSEVFLRYNDTPGTGITYHVEHLVAGSENGTEVKNLTDALCAIPDVLEFLRLANELAEQ